MRFLISALLGVVLTGPAAAAPVDFQLPDLNGKIHRISEFRGKWVIVNYWATWCPPCRSEIPELIFFHDAHKDKDAVVVGINAEEAPPEQVQAFVDEYMITYPVLLSDPDDGTPLGGMRGLPTTFLISPKGNVVYTHLGMVNRQLLETWLVKYQRTQTTPVQEARR